MHTTRLAAIAALFLAAACAGRGNDASATADTTTVAVAAPSEAARAAAIANAIMALPTSSDSILTANGLTADQFEAMIYRVARDSVLSAEYGRLTAR